MPEGAFLLDGHPASKAELLPFLPVLRIGHACNAAKLVAPEGDGRLEGGGDPTEGALLVAARKAGLDRQFDLRLRPVVRRLAFEAKRKRMSTIHRALPRRACWSPTSRVRPCSCWSTAPRRW